MKKLIIASVLSFVGFTAFANAGTTLKSTDPVVIIVQDFQEISVTDLPDPITAALAKDYPTAKVDKAYKNQDGQYKLELSLQDGAAGTVYADAEGNWIDM